MLDINAKMIYEYCLKNKQDDEHFNEWKKVSHLNLQDDAWDRLVILLCEKGKGTKLSDKELDYLTNLMLPDCHN